MRDKLDPRPKGSSSTVRGGHVFVSDLRLSARVGVNPNEQGSLQPIIVDVWVGLEDIEQPARSQRLRDTLDYVAVARTARKVVEERHWPLVETLATRIGQAVLARPGATWVRVRLRKPNSLRHASAAGVEVELGVESSDERLQPVALESLADPEAILVLGGGVAGLASVLWCSRLGYPALLVDDAESLGGQLHLVHGTMPDLTGVGPLSGPALARRLTRQLAHLGARWLRARVAGLESGPELCRVRLAGGEELRARALILALGARRRALGIPGEQDLSGRGVLDTAGRDTQRLAGKRVVVIGGGDSACENALLLAGDGARVTLVHRRERLSARQQLVRRLEPAAVTLVLGARPLRFIGTERLEGVAVETAAGEQVLAADAALVRIGWLPNSEGLPAAWLGTSGYLLADVDGRVAGEPAVFAAGDLLGRLGPSVATSVGTAATAARAAVMLLESRER